MPIIKSAKKRVRIAEKRTLRNREWKNKLKTVIKDFNAAVSEGNSNDAGEKLKIAIKIIDTAAGKGILHKNTAARKKSRLTKIYNQMAS